MMSRKFYISSLVALLCLGGIVVVSCVVISVHDALHYQSLPQPYRLAIQKLQDGWHYTGLSSNEQEAVLAEHKQWKDEGKLPWWGADQAVDPDIQKTETLTYFEKFVPRWGLRINQQHPLLAVLISLLAFAPAIAFASVVKGVCWIRARGLEAGPGKGARVADHDSHTGDMAREFDSLPLVQSRHNHLKGSNMLKQGWYLLAGVLVAHAVFVVGQARMAAHAQGRSVNWASLAGEITGSIFAYLCLGAIIGYFIYAIDRYVVRRG